MLYFKPFFFGGGGGVFATLNTKWGILHFDKAEDQNQIRTSSWPQMVNKPSRIRPHEGLQLWLINTVSHLSVTNN